MIFFLRLVSSVSKFIILHNDRLAAIDKVKDLPEPPFKIFNSNHLFTLEDSQHGSQKILELCGTTGKNFSNVSG